MHFYDILTLSHKYFYVCATERARACGDGDDAVGAASDGAGNVLRRPGARLGTFQRPLRVVILVLA